MATAQKIQFLASQLMGLGDRFQQESQARVSNALAQRHMNLSENEFAQQKKQADLNLAFNKFQQASEQEAANMLKAKKIPVTTDALAAALPEAKQRVWVSSPEFKAALGPEFKKVYTPAPVDIGFGGQVPQQLNPLLKRQMNSIQPMDSPLFRKDLFQNNQPGLPIGP